jgi:hypothetical protein
MFAAGVIMTFENQLRNAQRILEISFPLLSLVKQARSFEEIEQHVLVFKRKAKYQRRRLALAHHPDKGGDEKKMQMINHAYDLIKALKVGRRPAPVQVYTYYYSYGYTTASSSTTGGNYYTA